MTRKEKFTDAVKSLDEMTVLLTEVNQVLLGQFKLRTDAYITIWEEYSDWSSSQPENLEWSATGELLDSLVTDGDPEHLQSTVSALSDSLEELSEHISLLKDLDVPLGFGRD